MTNKCNTILVMLSVILCLVSVSAISQTKIESEATIKLVFHYSSKNKIGNEIQFRTYPAGNAWETGIDYIAKKESDSVFICRLPISKNVLPFSIRNASLKKQIKGWVLYDFFAEAGDKIKIDIYDSGNNGVDSMLFSGYGSEKYSLLNKFCKKALFDQSSLYENFVKNIDKVEDSSSMVNLIRGFCEEAKTNQLKRQSLVNNFSINISEQIKSLIVANHHLDESRWTDLVFLLHKKFKANPKLYATLIEQVDFYDGNFIFRSDDYSIMAHYNFKGLLNVLETKFQVRNYDFTVDIVPYYNVLKKYSSSEKIRDRLLSHFFMWPPGSIGAYNPEILDSLLIDASKYLISESGKTVLINKLTFKQGQKFFDTNFVDLDGKIVNTSSLKGKVFLLESWSIGCSGCAIFHKRFEDEVWPTLKNKKDFIVLSVNAAKTKEVWNKGLGTNLYSSSHYRNVSTMPLDIKTHPLFKHYEVNYFPFMLLIDKEGKIISKVEPNMTSTSLLKLINKAIEDKQL